MSSSCAKCNELQAAYDAFQAESKELESELEQELTAAHAHYEQTKAKLDKAVSALSSERESNSASQAQLLSQINSMQAELAKANAQVESLKVARRQLEEEQSRLETRVRRAEAAAADASERADSQAEQALMLKQELEEHQATHAEYEQRTRTQLKEMKEELANTQRQSEQQIAAATTAAKHEVSNAALEDQPDVSQLQEEIQLLTEEKEQLQLDIAEISTDLTRAQEENEKLNTQIVELQSKGSAESAAAPQSPAKAAAAPAVEAPATSLASDLAEIAHLKTTLQSLEANSAAAAAQSKKQLEEVQAQHAKELQAVQAAQTASTARIAQLESELTSAQSSSSAGAQKHSELEVQQTKLNKELTEAQATIQTLNQQLAQSQEKVSSIGKELESRQSSVDSLTKQLSESSAAAQQAAKIHEKALNDLQARLTEQEQASKVALQSVTSSSDNTAQQIASLKSELSASQRALATAEEDAKDFNRVAADRNARIAKLEQQVASLSAFEKQATASAEREKKLSEQLTQLQNELYETKQNTASAEASAELQSKIDELSKQLSEANDKVTELQSSLVTSESNLNTEVEKHVLQIRELNISLKNQTLAHEELQLKSQQEQKQLQEYALLKSQHSDIQQTVKQLESSLSAKDKELQSKHSSSSDEASRTAKQISAVNESLATAESTIASLTVQLTQSQSSMKQLESSNAQLNSQIKDLQSAHTKSGADADAANADLKKQLQQLTAERTALESQLSESVASKSSLDAELFQLKAENEAFESRLQAAQEAASLYQSDIEEMQTRMQKDLDDKCASLITAADARAAATLAAKVAEMEVIKSQLTEEKQAKNDVEEQLKKSEAKRLQAEKDAASITGSDMSSIMDAHSSPPSHSRQTSSSSSNPVPTTPTIEENVAASSLAAPAPATSGATTPRAMFNALTSLSGLKKEKSQLLSQVADLSAQAAHYSEQFLKWELEKQNLKQSIELKSQEISILQSQNQTLNASLTSPVKASPDALNQSINGDFSSPAPSFNNSSFLSPSPSRSPSSVAASPPIFASPAPAFSLQATVIDREKADPAHMTEIESLLKKDLDGLHTQVMKMDQSTAQSIQPVVESLTTDIQNSLTLMASLQSNLASSTDRELDLMGKLQTIKGTNIRVFCRVRPMLPHEMVEPREENLLQFPSEQQVSIRADVAKKNRTRLAELPSQSSQTSSSTLSVAFAFAQEDDGADALSTSAPASYTPYNFDKIFLPQSTQEDVYESVEEMILPVLNGYRACIFAYGQTGSGKTYTMEGANFAASPLPASSAKDSDIGITFRALETLFRGMANRGSSYKYEIRLTLLELYNEQWKDLLEGTTVGQAYNESEDFSVADPADDDSSQAAEEDALELKIGRKLQVRKGPNGMFVDGATRRIVSNVAEVLTLLQQGSKLRHTEATNLNESSSRSHLLMLVDVVGINQVTQVTSYGRLSLVDLAGSERVKNSGATGARLTEAANINKSLSALADVFTALTDPKNKHVPFRNSKLTHLLSDSFVGNSKTLMFVNISPAAMHAGETLCSLQFAARARQVRLNQAQASLDGWGHKYKTMLATQQAAFATREKNYLAELKQLKTSLKSRDRQIEALQVQVKALQERVAEADRRFERSEAERLRSFTTLKPGSPSPRDRKAELEDDKKWNSLQAELTSQQNKLFDLKAANERSISEWKEKYAAMEVKYRDQVERMRLARMEWNEKRKVSAYAYDDDGTMPAEDNPEVQALTRQVALLELEVKRLKLSRNASLAKAKSPRSKLAKHEASLALNATDDNAGDAEPSPNSTASPSVTLSRTISYPTGGSSSRSASAARGSGIPSFGSSSSSSALAAAKQAALAAQKRAQDAQSKSNVEGSLDTSRIRSTYTFSSGSTSVPASRSSSRKRQSLLPAPTTKIGAKSTVAGGSSSIPPKPSSTTPRESVIAAAGALKSARFVSSSGSSPVITGMSAPIEVAGTLDESSVIANDNNHDQDDETPPNEVVTSPRRGGTIALPMKSAKAPSSKIGSKSAASASALPMKRSASAKSSSVVVKPIKVSQLAKPTATSNFGFTAASANGDATSDESAPRSLLRAPVNFTSAPAKK